MNLLNHLALAPQGNLSEDATMVGDRWFVGLMGPVAALPGLKTTLLLLIESAPPRNR